MEIKDERKEKGGRERAVYGGRKRLKKGEGKGGKGRREGTALAWGVASKY